jgi:hypothetical protein
MLISLVFFPAVLLGQVLGHVGGEILYNLYSTIGLLLPDFLFVVAPDVISSLVGGALAAVVCSKIYKQYHTKFILIIPLLLSVLSAIGPLLTMNTEGLLTEKISISLSNFCLFITFYYVLRNFYPTQFASE